MDKRHPGSGTKAASGFFVCIGVLLLIHGPVDELVRVTSLSRWSLRVQVPSGSPKKKQPEA